MTINASRGSVTRPMSRTNYEETDGFSPAAKDNVDGDLTDLIKNFPHLNMSGDEKMDWADQEVGVTCCQEEEHNEEMEWITSRNPSFCIWRERKDEEDSL
uniref:Uncharacterized protein n=1 Tax=Oncorhynchus tshawytscha TaxID=74940 RepID=A0AAZ3SDH6_ONCTS